MNKWKRMVAVAMALLTCFGTGFCGVDITVKAEEYNEGSVAHASMETAVAMTKDAVYTGQVTKEDDWYTYIIPENGYFYVSLTAISGGIDSLMYCKIYAGTQKLEQLSADDSKGEVRSHKHAYKKGSRIYLDLSKSFSDVNYSVAIHFVKSNYWEKESNNYREDANSIQLSKNYMGNCGDTDMDWFVYKAKKKGYYQVSAQPGDTESGYTLEIFVNNKSISRLGITNGSGLQKSKKILVKKGQKIYIKTSEVTINNRIYKFKLKKV